MAELERDSGRADARANDKPQQIDWRDAPPYPELPQGGRTWPQPGATPGGAPGWGSARWTPQQTPPQDGARSDVPQPYYPQPYYSQPAPRYQEPDGGYRSGGWPQQVPDYGGQQPSRPTPQSPDSGSPSADDPHYPFYRPHPWLPPNEAPQPAPLPTTPPQRYPMGPDGGFNGNGQYDNPPHFIPQVQIPVLIPGRRADENLVAITDQNNPIAQLYDKVKPSIVQVIQDGHGMGSGFFVSKSGEIVTDYHVISEKGKVHVKTADGQDYDANVVKTKPSSDLALLQIVPHHNGESFKPMELAPTATNLKSGEVLFTMGHPQGWPNIYLSPGQVIGFDKRSRSGIDATWNPNETTIRSDVHVEPGNSGGPTFDPQGRVRGIADYSNLANQWMTSVDELHSMLGSGNSLRDYVIPNDLHFDAGTAMYGGASAMRALAFTGRASVLGSLGSGLNLWMGARNAFQDIPNLEAAMSSGTWGDKVNAGINVTSDALMLSGLLSINSKMRVVTGIAQVAGAGLRFGNELLSDRKY